MSWRSVSVWRGCGVRGRWGSSTCPPRPAPPVRQGAGTRTLARRPAVLLCRRSLLPSLQDISVSCVGGTLRLSPLIEPVVAGSPRDVVDVGRGPHLVLPGRDGPPVGALHLASRGQGHHLQLLHVGDGVRLVPPGREPGLSVGVKWDVVEEAGVEPLADSHQSLSLRLRASRRTLVNLRAGVCRGSKSVADMEVPVDVHSMATALPGWRSPVLPPESVLCVTKLIAVRVE